MGLDIYTIIQLAVVNGTLIIAAIVRLSKRKREDEVIEIAGTTQAENSNREHKQRKPTNKPRKNKINKQRTTRIQAWK